MANEKNQTVEELQQQLNEANARLANALPDPAKKVKPYSPAEISAHEKSGHVIGKPDQKLSDGHLDLYEWEQWIVEIGLKNIGKLPELGQEWSVPDYLIPLKREKAGLKGNDKSFQWQNKQMDFRYPASERRYTLYLPKGMEANKRYEAHYWVESVMIPGGSPQKIARLLVKDFPKITGAPEDKNLWGKG